MMRKRSSNVFLNQLIGLNPFLLVSCGCPESYGRKRFFTLNAKGMSRVEPDSSVSGVRVEIRIELFCTFRTDTVGEVSLGAIPDIGFNLIPITLIITDLLAG